MQSTRSSFETLINLQFPQHIFEKQSLISGFIKIRPVGAELFHVDRQTDRWSDRHHEANRRFSQFCVRAK